MPYPKDELQRRLDRLDDEMKSKHHYGNLFSSLHNDHDDERGERSGVEERHGSFEAIWETGHHCNYLFNDTCDYSSDDVSTPSLRHDKNNKFTSKMYHIADVDEEEEEEEWDFMYYNGDAVAALEEDDNAPDEERPSRVTRSLPKRPEKPKRKTQCRKKKYHERDLRCCGHGCLTTAVALGIAWTASFCAMEATRSWQFVHLREPMPVGANYLPLHQLGLLNVQICLNATRTGFDDCGVYPLDSREINETMFAVARLLLLLGTTFGCFFTAVLSTAVVWETINLRPIGVGFMIAYVVQAFSLLFFETELCKKYQCRVDDGCQLCIVACLGWLASCLASVQMDKVKARARQYRALRRQGGANKNKKKRQHKDYRLADMSQETEVTAAFSLDE